MPISPQRLTRGRRMVGLRLTASAGVDHGAVAAQMGGAEGWLVMKADGSSVCATCAGTSAVTPANSAFTRAPVPPGAAEGTARPCPDCGGRGTVTPVTPKAAPAPPLASTTPTVGKAAAWQEIEAAGADLRKTAAAAGTPMTQEQAITKATELRPDLVAAWRCAGPDPTPPPSTAVAETDQDPTEAAAALLQKRAVALAKADKIPLSLALDRVFGSKEGVALRALDAATHGRGAEAVALARASLTMRC